MKYRVEKFTKAVMELKETCMKEMMNEDILN